MVHTPPKHLNDPLRCSQGAAAGVLKPLWILRFGVLLGVLGVEVLGGVLGRWWGLWRENWLYLWITATAREVVQCCWGGVEHWAAFGVPVGSCGRVLKVEWWYFK